MYIISSCRIQKKSLIKFRNDSKEKKSGNKVYRILFSLIPFAVLLGGAAHFLFENAKEVLGVIVAYRFGNLVHFSVRGLQQLGSFIDSDIVQVIDKFHAGPLSKERTQIASVQVKTEKR